MPGLANLGAMLRIEECRRAMKEAEIAYVAAARAYFEGPTRGTRETGARYHAAMGSMIAAYDQFALVSPRTHAI